MVAARKVTAHSGRLSGARAGVAGGVDAIEHGFELDADVAADMAGRGTVLVSTLAVMRSWLTFGRTTTLPRFATADGRRAIEARLERAVESVQLARRAGVAIAAGTDFGGGSLRANQLAWEVESLVAAGMEPWEALGAATWRGGELLGEPDGRGHRRGRPGRLPPRPRRPDDRPGGALARLARGLGRLTKRRGAGRAVIPLGRRRSRLDLDRVHDRL